MLAVTLQLPPMNAAALELISTLSSVDVPPAGKATSTKPAAAAKLAELLNQLRSSAVVTKPKLAAVRQMTKNDGA